MKPEMTVHQAVLKALNTRWMCGFEIVKFVKQETGTLISESAATARVRDLRKQQFGAHPVTCRYVGEIKGRRRWEYGIAE